MTFWHGWVSSETKSEINNNIFCRFVNLALDSKNVHEVIFRHAQIYIYKL